jgi:UDP-glucose 4-epimerase
VKNVIVSGASGFIGTDLIRELQNDYTILAIGRNFKEKTTNKNIHYLIGNINELTSDDTDKKIPDKSFSVFVHAAGQAHIAQTPDTLELFRMNNVKATENALKLARELKVEKFIFLSSIAVNTNDPHDQYGTTKREAEEIVKDFCKQNRIDYVIVRPVVVYGENDQKGNVSKLIKQISKGFFPLLNNGNTIKSMIYVKNLSCFIRMLMESNLYDNSTLVARDPQELTFRQICVEVKKELNKPTLLLPISPIMVNLLIFSIGAVQRMGVLKSFNLRSLRNLNMQTNYKLKGLNEELVNQLPFSIYSGLKNTVKNK